MSIGVFIIVGGGYPAMDHHLIQKDVYTLSHCNTKARDEWQADPRGSTSGISGTLEPLAYTRASSAEFYYSILE